MWVLSVNSDGVRCARSCMFGVSTIATLIEPPARVPPPFCLWPPQPATATAPIASRTAIHATRTDALMALLPLRTCSAAACACSPKNANRRSAGAQRDTMAHHDHPADRDPAPRDRCDRVPVEARRLPCDGPKVPRGLGDVPPPRARAPRVAANCAGEGGVSFLREVAGL